LFGCDGRYWRAKTGVASAGGGRQGWAEQALSRCRAAWAAGRRWGKAPGGLTFVRGLDLVPSLARTPVLAGIPRLAAGFIRVAKAWLAAKVRRSSKGGDGSSQMCYWSG
jgi:hypothetical protein